MSVEKIISTGQLQNLMSEIMVLRKQVKHAERNRPQSIVQSDRLLKLRKIQTTVDVTVPAARRVSPWR